MESVRDLQPILRMVQVPTHLSVTQLASSGDCGLRAIIPQSAQPNWAPSPEAEFGRIVHSLMDLAARGEIDSTDADPCALGLALDQLLQKEETNLMSAAATQSFACLRTAFSSREWRKRRSLAIARTLELLSARRLRRRDLDSTDIKRVSLSDALQRKGFAASEIVIKSEKLRLRARIDYLSVSADGLVEVSDFKSGNVLNHEGEVEDVTALQLRLYGLVILELNPQAHLQLKVVGRGGTSFVPFSDADIQNTRQWLAQRTSRLPDGEWIGTDRVAVVGPQCRGCKARVVCPAYRASVSELWKRSDLLIQLPLDIAGRILHYESAAEGTTTLKIIDLAGRTAKIHRLCGTTWPPNDRDLESVYWFFNLASSEIDMRNGKWRHPRNFHELPSSSQERRAWTLHVYRAGVL